jgi:hypothetical protein
MTQIIRSSGVFAFPSNIPTYSSDPATADLKLKMWNGVEIVILG